MKTLRISVSDLDSLIWYHRIEQMSVKEMIGRLKRTEPRNEKMIIGTAWHDILENPPSIIDKIESGGYTFIIDCDAQITLPQTREIFATKKYIIENLEITLAGKCDGATIPKITDHKLTFRPNPESYMDALQWKAYLDIFNGDVFEYIIYSAYHKKATNEIIIKDIYPMYLYRYPNMEKDLTHGIRELVEFIRDHTPELIKGA